MAEILLRAKVQKTLHATVAKNFLSSRYCTDSNRQLTQKLNFKN